MYAVRSLSTVRFSSESKGPGGSTATASTAGICRPESAISAFATEESAAWAASSGLAASLFRIACLRRDQRAKRLSSPVLIRHHPRCENPALLLQQPPDRCDRASAWSRAARRGGPPRRRRDEPG